MESVKLSADQQRLAADNRGLAYHIAKQLRNHGVDREDLESEALAALCRAAAFFDPSRGIKFSSYACRAIVFKLIRFVELEHREQFLQLESLDQFGRDDEEHELDAPEQCERIRAKLPRRLWRILWLRSGEGMKLKDVARRFGVSKERIRQLQKNAMARIA